MPRYNEPFSASDAGRRNRKRRTKSDPESFHYKKSAIPPPCPPPCSSRQPWAAGGPVPTDRLLVCLFGDQYVQQSPSATVLNMPVHGCLGRADGGCSARIVRVPLGEHPKLGRPSPRASSISPFANEQAAVFFFSWKETELHMHLLLRSQVSWQDQAIHGLSHAWPKSCFGQGGNLQDQ